VRGAAVAMRLAEKYDDEEMELEQSVRML